MQRSSSRKAVPLPLPADEDLEAEEEERHAAIFGRKGELLEDAHSPQPSFALSRHVGGSHTPLDGNTEHTLAGRKRLSGQHVATPPELRSHVPTRSKTHNHGRFEEEEFREGVQATQSPSAAEGGAKAGAAPKRGMSRTSSMVPQPGGFHKGVLKP